MIKNLFLIITIYVAASIESDIYLPAFVDMMNFFKVSESQIQQILTINFIGLFIASPFYGPISDSIGRKKPLIFSLFLFLVGSVITVITSDFNIMLIGRFLQGVGGGGCFVLGSAIIFDIYSDIEAIRIINYLGASIPIIMAFAPPIGGYLNLKFGFVSNFLLILILVLVSFIITATMYKETLVNKKPFCFKKVMRDFSILFKNNQFLKLNVTLSFDWAGYILFLAITSVLFVEDFGLKKEYFPLVQLGFIVPYTLGSLTANKVTSKFGEHFTKHYSVISILIGTALFIVASYFYSRDPITLTISTIPVSFGFAWYNAPYTNEIMSIFENLKGAASSVLISTRLIITSLLVFVVSHYSKNTIYPLTISMSLIAILLFFLTRSFEKTKKLNTMY